MPLLRDYAGDDNLSRATEKLTWFSGISFNNPFPTWEDKKITDVGLWLTGWKPSSEKAKGSCCSRTSVSVSNGEPLESIAPNFTEEILKNGVQMTWLGHASVLMEVDGWRVLTDPIFSERCSPFSKIGGYTRQIDLHFNESSLPLIDAVVISHNHYDHLDVATVRNIHQSQLQKRIEKKVSQSLVWCVPQGLKSWMEKTLVDKDVHIEECKWWEQLHFPANEKMQLEAMKLCFVPAQHWSGRKGSDRNMSLWGGWVVVGAQHRAYFSGDTGYCRVFEEIGRVYGPLNMAALPIGAYEPRWFMKAQHVNPAEAVMIHRDVQAQLSLGVHWGTFKLTDEPLMEPPQALKQALVEYKLPPNVFQTVPLGGTLKFDPDLFVDTPSSSNNVTSHNQSEPAGSSV